MAEKYENHTPVRKSSYTNPPGLLPVPTICKKVLYANLLQHPPENLAQHHQIEFPAALGKATRQEMVDTLPDVQDPEVMLDQGIAKAHLLTLQGKGAQEKTERR